MGDCSSHNSAFGAIPNATYLNRTSGEGQLTGCRRSVSQRAYEAQDMKDISAPTSASTMSCISAKHICYPLWGEPAACGQG